MKSAEKVNTKALLRHSFDCLKLLKSGSINTEEAKAHANLLKQSNNLLKYELDRAIAEQKFENITIRDIEDSE